MHMEFYGITPELYRAIVQIVDERIKEIKITHEDFTALKKTVEDSSKLVDQRLAEVATILADLAKAQKETREETARLDKALARLAEAQAELMVAQKSTQRGVARLAETLGFSLEDIARIVLPGYLERHLRAKVEKLKRKHFNIEGNEYEIDLYGEGQRNGNRVIVVGKVKYRIYAREVRSFNKILARIIPLINKDRDVIKVMFGFLVHPSAEEIARKEDILLVASYER